MTDEWYVARRGQDGNKRYGPVPLRLKAGGPARTSVVTGAGQVGPNEISVPQIGTLHVRAVQVGFGEPKPL